MRKILFTGNPQFCFKILFLCKNIILLSFQTDAKMKFCIILYFRKFWNIAPIFYSSLWRPCHIFLCCCIQLYCRIPWQIHAQKLSQALFERFLIRVGKESSSSEMWREAELRMPFLLDETRWQIQQRKNCWESKPTSPSCGARGSSHWKQFCFFQGHRSLGEWFLGFCLPTSPLFLPAALALLPFQWWPCERVCNLGGEAGKWC